VIGGTALRMAADEIIAKSKKIVAHLLDVAVVDLDFADGRLTVASTDRAVPSEGGRTGGVSSGPSTVRSRRGSLRDRHVQACHGYISEWLPNLRA
jgi:hypothetical protein